MTWTPTGVGAGRSTSAAVQFRFGESGYLLRSIHTPGIYSARGRKRGLIKHLLEPLGLSSGRVIRTRLPRHRYRSRSWRTRVKKLSRVREENPSITKRRIGALKIEVKPETVSLIVLMSLSNHISPPSFLAQSLPTRLYSRVAVKLAPISLRFELRRNDDPLTLTVVVFHLIVDQSGRGAG